MQQRMRRSGIIIRLLSLGLLAGVALTASPATAVDITGPYYPEPAWAMKLAPAFRFGVLTNWNSEAVLDRETGLVWERTPAVTSNTWTTQRFACTNKVVGGRKGWRLPSIAELMSLTDRSVVNPALPSGHPFLNVQGDYWTAESTTLVNLEAWTVDLNAGFAFTHLKDNSNHVWCVRGGVNTAEY